MATDTKTLVGGAGKKFADADAWNPVGVPGASTIVLMDGTSGNLDLGTSGNEDLDGDASLGQLDMTGYTGTLTVANDVDGASWEVLNDGDSATGDVILDWHIVASATAGMNISCDGNLTVLPLAELTEVTVEMAGAKAARSNANPACDLQVTPNATITLLETGATSAWHGIFVVPGTDVGTLACGTLNVEVSTCVQMGTAAVITGTGTWTITAGSTYPDRKSWWKNVNYPCPHLIVNAGAAVVLDGTVYTRKLTCSGTITAAATKKIYVYLGTGNDIINVSGTIGPNVNVDVYVGTANATNAGGINMPNGALGIFNVDFKVRGTITCASLLVHSSLDLTGSSGMHSLGTVTVDAAPKTLTLGASIVKWTGAMSLTGTCTAAGAYCVSGTPTGITGWIRCYGNPAATASAVVDVTPRAGLGMNTMGIN